MNRTMPLTFAAAFTLSGCTTYDADGRQTGVATGGQIAAGALLAVVAAGVGAASSRYARRYGYPTRSSYGRTLNRDGSVTEVKRTYKGGKYRTRICNSRRGCTYSEYRY